MVVTNLQANNAYMSALKNISSGEDKAGNVFDAGNEQSDSFGNMVSETVNKVVEAGRDADTKMTAQAVGKVDVVDVVTAVAETEVAIQTLVSVRDRVISAYQDILRMPI